MSWVLILLTVWVLVAVAAAVVIGRSVRVADAEAEAARAGRADLEPPGQRTGADGAARPDGAPATSDAVRHARPARRRPTFRGCIAATGRATLHRGRGAV